MSTASGSFAFFTDYANNFTGDGRTNWDDALFKATNSGADLTLFITDGEPNEYTTQPPHSGHTGNPSSGDRPLSFAVNHANAIKSVDGSRMFVVGVGNATNHTTEIKAVSGTNGPGLDVATNDFSLTSNFNDLAASLRALVFSLCQSTMTVTKLVDGQPANGWGVTATITSVTGAPGFDWRFPSEPATPPASRTVSTSGAGTATFDWVIGSEAAPVPGSVEMTIDEVGQAGFQFTGGTCNIESATRTAQDVPIATLAVQHRNRPLRCHRAMHLEQPDDPDHDDYPNDDPDDATDDSTDDSTDDACDVQSHISHDERDDDNGVRGRARGHGNSAPHRWRW